MTQKEKIEKQLNELALKATDNMIKASERKYGVKITIEDGLYVARYKSGKEVCREKGIVELQIALKLYLS